MMRYSYVAMDSRGREKKGSVDADSQRCAVSKVREKGLFPTSIMEDSGKTVVNSEQTPIVDEAEEGGDADKAGEDFEQGGIASLGPSAEFLAAIDMMAASCGAMLAGLLKNGFMRSEAVEVVKVFIAESVKAGLAGCGKADGGKQ